MREFEEDVWVYDEDRNKFKKEVSEKKTQNTNKKTHPEEVIKALNLNTQHLGQKIGDNGKSKNLGKKPPAIAKLDGQEFINMRKSESKIETPHF